jgi:hypothetical protein
LILSNRLSVNPLALVVNDSKKQQARKAKAAKLAAASIIATRPKPVRDNNMLLGEVQPFKPPSSTGGTYWLDVYVPDGSKKRHTQIHLLTRSNI